MLCVFLNSNAVHIWTDRLKIKSFKLEQYENKNRISSKFDWTHKILDIP